jgi:hypothetical protein
MADFLWICIRDGFNLGLAIRVQMRRKGGRFATERMTGRTELSWPAACQPNFRIADYTAN